MSETVNNNLHEQPLTEHLAELRSCLIYSSAAVFAGFLLAYMFVKQIGEWFLEPLYNVLPENSTLIFASYQEAFFFI